MPTEEQVRESLTEVLVPAVQRNLVELNLVRQISINGKNVNITLASTALDKEMQDWVKNGAEEVAAKLPDIDKVAIEFTEAKPAEINEIKHVIAVMSGKGGVGKSLITSLVAIALRRLGNEVGILDADITGPSIPRMFGINSRPAGSETGILPVISRSGIEVMSMNVLLPQEDSAVIWRGPLMGKAITQFWEEVLWGKLDYLVVDLPPGTADAPLTVLQTLPVSGIVIVFTPQDLTTMIVKKAVNMAEKMEKTVLGVVENMSYLYVPEIDKKIELFGKSQGEEMAKAAHAPLLGKLPVDPSLAALCDNGEVERYDSEFVDNVGQPLIQAISTGVSQ